MKILVRNLSKVTTEATLQGMFQAYGQVQYCTLINDRESGQHKGFGFIEMPKAVDAKKAIQALNNAQVDGKAIRVKRAIAKVVDAPESSPTDE
ncbi:RNA-binding protein [Reinekea sp.]|jgi:RNA recognition motif-containing protein|uniref:RNA recognition motif domain-containing protein n=1 Tax=Reinekea sp. TaxID=1970455 RepID=UPI002A806E60|nr:RNA-binding protein [Reinekea sp.]